jgi:hypothetical protein
MLPPVLRLSSLVRLRGMYYRGDHGLGIRLHGMLSCASGLFSY